MSIQARCDFSKGTFEVSLQTWKQSSEGVCKTMFVRFVITSLKINLGVDWEWSELTRSDWSLLFKAAFAPTAYNSVDTWAALLLMQAPYYIKKLVPLCCISELSVVSDVEVHGSKEPKPEGATMLLQINTFNNERMIIKKEQTWIRDIWSSIKNKQTKEEEDRERTTQWATGFCLLP